MRNQPKCQCGSFVATHCRRCKRQVNGAEITNLQIAALDNCVTIVAQGNEIQRLGSVILTEHKTNEWLSSELNKKTKEINSIRLSWYARRWYAAVRWLTTFDRGA